MDRYIDKLVNMQVVGMGRIKNTFCIRFSNDKESYVLQVQAAWRIKDKNTKTIAVAQMDEFMQSEENKEIAIFGIKIKNLRNKIENKIVTLCSMNDYGDLKIDIGDNYILEIFIDTSEEEECWRIQKYESDEKQYVFYGKIGGILE